MRVLAFDSALASCSVALWSDDSGAPRIEAAERSLMARGHAEALAPMTWRVMRAAAAEFGALDLIAVTRGPGHFTGLRAGLAHARGLAFACGCKLVGITTLEAVAAAVTSAERAGRRVLVTLDSKLAQAYVQPFDATLAPLAAPSLARPAALAQELASNWVLGAPWLLAGDGAPALAAALAAVGVAAQVASDAALPDAGIVAGLAASRDADGGRAPEPPEPLYLHPPALTQARETGARGALPV